MPKPTLEKLQQTFILGGIVWAPLLPFLYLQSKYVRYKVGRLPDAGGETTGEVSGGGKLINFLAIGESTIAGIGAVNHETALTGQFAKHLSALTGSSVRWQALGVSGITVERAITELLPQTPAIAQDLVLIALGGNDVFHLHTPRRSRRNMNALIDALRKKYPAAKILLANVPMVRDFTALPHPLKYFLSRIAKLHHFNTIEMTDNLPNVHYYLPQGKFRAEHFSDGIHPSESGYDLWAKEMVNYFDKQNAFN
jgi:lysophospholipase L1-like esterase